MKLEEFLITFKKKELWLHWFGLWTACTVCFTIVSSLTRGLSVGFIAGPMLLALFLGIFLALNRNVQSVIASLSAVSISSVIFLILRTTNFAGTLNSQVYFTLWTDLFLFGFKLGLGILVVSWIFFFASKAARLMLSGYFKLEDKTVKPRK